MMEGVTGVASDAGDANEAHDQLRVGEFLLGVAGLALLRSGGDGEAPTRADRLTEMHAIVAELGHDLTLDEPFAGDEHAIDDGYRVWSQTYDRPLRLFPVESPPVCWLIDRLRRGTVLDVACGSGRHTAYLAEVGHEVIGIDRSEPMLRLARRNVPSGRFAQADLSSVPLGDATIDNAVCGLALVHVADLDGAFAEMSRVIRVGGRFLVSDVHPTLVTLGWQAQFPDGDSRAFIRLRHHRMSDYVEAALRNGFAIRGCTEPLVTPDVARTPTAGRIPEASEQAFAGLPAVVVWEFERV
jgi:SAM-dependent methyltransferase